MECRKVSAVIPDYADGLLGAAESARVETHLKRCKTCAAGLEDYRSYMQRMRGLARVKAPDGFMKELHEKLGAPPQKRGFREKIFLPLKIKLPLEAAGLAAACAVMVIFFDPFGFRHTPERGMPGPEERSSVTADGRRDMSPPVKSRADTRRRRITGDDVASRERFGSKRRLGEEAMRDISKLESDDADKDAVEKELTEYQEIAVIFDRSPSADMGAAQIDKKKRADSLASESASGMGVMKETAKKDRRATKEGNAPGGRDAGNACDTVAGIAASVNGRVLKSEASDGICKTVILEIPQQNYVRFMEKMRVIGGRDAGKGFRQSEKALKKQQVPVRVHIIDK